MHAHRRAGLAGLVLLVLVAGIAGAAERTHVIVPEDYFSQVFLSDLATSPDGSMTAFVDYRWDKENDKRSRDIWVLHHDSRALNRLTFDPGNETGPVWSPDGHWIYFQASLDHGRDQAPGDGSHQVWRIHPDGSGLMAVTRVPDGIYDFDLLADGSGIVYSRTREFMIDDWAELRGRYKGDMEFGHGIHDVHTLHHLDLASWRTRELADPGYYIHEFAVSPDMEQIAMITTEDGELVSLEGFSDVRVLEIDSGDIVTLPDARWRDEAPSPFGWLSGLAWSEDSEGLAFHVDFDGYPAEVIVAHADYRDVVVMRLPRPNEVTMAGNVRWVPGENAIAFLADDHARQRVMAVDIETGDYETMTTGDVVIDGFEFAGDRGALVAIQSELTYYHDIVHWDHRGRPERLTKLNPQVDEWILPQISIVSWTASDGTEVEGILELPAGYEAGDGPLPLIVNLHGGPTASEKYCFLFWIYGRAAYAAKGYAMFAPNYRGSTGYGDTFLTDLIGHENDRDVDDIMTGIDHLVEAGIVDEDRMGVMGWSNGGFLTNCLIATNRFKAASSGAGVLDMTTQLLEEDTPGHVINYMEGMPWDVPQEYQDASPLYSYKPGMTTPTLIHVGEGDPRVPASHARGLHRMLTRYLDVPCELIVYPGAGHGLTRYTHRLAKQEWDHAWFDHYLLGK